jgi:hypothetical protein
VINEITDNRKLLDRPVYSLEKDEDGGMDLHPVSRPELDAAADKVEEWHTNLDIPINLKGVSEHHDVSMYDLVNHLTERGWTINWDDMNNPSATKQA